MKISKLLLVTFISVFLAACASSNSGSVYNRDDARKVQTVKTGVVESVRAVKLEGTKIASRHGCWRRCWWHCRWLNRQWSW